ncbi:TPA: hypothetical protein N0F65_006210 [Lagenidium giganteum]|uniref:Tc1-like transposase DDE domain-containing protein n=1 Tax=Lagenidium giganteum TaxID=4803 RepID=A0AAV2Z930_9STRA|nr:TPA: hypothetical protein N0F65_006210 [Lagenidium giganteum]
MQSFYTYPEQVVCVDETRKNGTDSARRFAWSRRGEKPIVRVPFSRGNRVTALAACDSNGFIAWTATRGTFFTQTVVPKPNPWPLPHSIVVIDNARIHMYPQIAEVIEQCGAIRTYLPPYCPHLSPR